MHRIPPNVLADEERLGQLAFQFRGARRDDERKKIAEEYAATVKRLIDSGGWDEAPPPEDQLPDAHMPPAFFAFWLNPPQQP